MQGTPSSGPLRAWFWNESQGFLDRKQHPRELCLASDSVRWRCCQPATWSWAELPLGQGRGVGNTHGRRWKPDWGPTPNAPFRLLMKPMHLRAKGTTGWRESAGNVNVEADYSDFSKWQIHHDHIWTDAACYSEQLANAILKKSPSGTPHTHWESSCSPKTLAKCSCSVSVLTASASRISRFLCNHIMWLNSFLSLLYSALW